MKVNRGRRSQTERGYAMAIEATIILPALVLFVALVIFLARENLAHQAVGASASQAARAASLERTPGTARAAATAVANSSLRDAGLSCRSQHIAVDTSALNATPGDPAAVSVTLTCLVIHDVVLPGFPQERRVSKTRTSPVDTYRGR